jgi:capsular exopolysaccharide synthesis family protein
VDGIRTVLIHEAELSDYRVIQITSAVSGEAKTTFAIQLARSLSRAHRRTVLVDLDLRRPSVHEVFGRELSAGVCEVLRGEANVDDVLLTSDQDRLALLLAGQCDAAALTALANDVINDMLSRLREQFEFVIIDSSPVLPVVDGLLVAQRADAVILMAMRDVSRAPRLREASERLWQVGGNVIGTVVTTKENRSYYDTIDRYVGA